MKVLEGKKAVLGRLASYAAKEVLKGEKIIVINCDEIVITGNKKNIEGRFLAQKGRIGSGQKGPKQSHKSELFVKRAIRGMLPNHRRGKGKVAYKNIKCFPSEPEDFKSANKITFDKPTNKFIKVKDLLNKNG